MVNEEKKLLGFLHYQESDVSFFKIKSWFSFVVNEEKKLLGFLHHQESDVSVLKINLCFFKKKEKV